MIHLRSALAALALLLGASPAEAEERITRFVSDVEIRADSSLDVTETIDVTVENDRIRHGIYRDFPTRYRMPDGGQKRVGFTLQGVTRDGVAEPATVGPVAGGVRIRIGDPDKFVEPGEHRYVLRYRTTRQIGRFAGFDEFYWNATGNQWLFPIDVAEARIRLPKAVPFGERAMYTGLTGSRESAARVIGEKPGEIVFQATRPLGPYEGLSVAVAFPKGVVAEPDDTIRAGWWLADYGPLVVGALGLLGVGIFYFVAWQRAGRNPRAGTMVPLFSPPDDLEPAALRYIWKMGADNRAFAAALVDAGVRGHVLMVEDDGGFFGKDKVRIERVAADRPLPAAEQAMLVELAMTGESIVMEQENHKRFSAAKKALSDAFKDRFEGRMFRRNWGWVAAGIAVFLTALWLTAAAVVAATGVVDPLRIGVALGSLVTAVLLVGLIQGVSTLGKVLLGILAFVAGGVAVALGMPILFAAFATGWWPPLLLPLLGAPIVVSAFWWMAAPTREGRAMLDRIMGFRHYLSVAEAPRLERMTPPDETPELFERYLPHAIALGVENKWAKRFEGVLAAASVQGTHQGFAWYSGHSTPWSNPGGFVNSVGASLAGSVGAASTAPGSGGGGSSGGGGGGGGGGGW